MALEFTSFLQPSMTPTAMPLDKRYYSSRAEIVHGRLAPGRRGALQGAPLNAC